MYRITQKDLEGMVNEINRLTGSPIATHTKGDDGHYFSNVDNYHLSYAYGGVSLHRFCNDGGGVITPLGGGYYTKRELYTMLQAYINGLCDAKTK